MKTGKIVTNQLLKCTCCNKVLDGYTGDKGSPTDGSITICAYCATVMVFKGKGMGITLETMPHEMMEQLLKEDPDTHKKISTYVDVTKRIINNRLKGIN